MAGHSQWANRKHRKARQDAKKGKIFSRMAREITVAAREGGKDLETNAKLRLAVERAREAGVPNENIERAIKRGTGELQGDAEQELMYEAYGPGGVAMMLRVLTDNRNRTAGDLRNLLTRYGGNLAEAGSVAWMFERKGVLVIDRQQISLAEDDVLMLALEAGAEDVRTEEETYEIITPPEAFETTREAFQKAGVTEFSLAEITQIPKSLVRLEGKTAEQLLKLLDALENHDDVADVYANFDIEADLLAAFEG